MNTGVLSGSTSSSCSSTVALDVFTRRAAIVVEENVHRPAGRTTRGNVRCFVGRDDTIKGIRIS